MLALILTLIHQFQWTLLARTHQAGPLVMVVRGYWSLCQVTWHGANAYANDCIALIKK